MSQRLDVGGDTHIRALPFSRRVLTGALLWISLGCQSLHSQVLEPTAYSSSPVGTNFLVLCCPRNSGAEVFDPTIPVEDVSTNINGMVLGYFHGLELVREAKERQAASGPRLRFILGKPLG